MDSEPITIGQRVKSIRIQRDMSRSDLATAVDHSIDWLKSVEIGRRALDRYSLIQGLAEALDVSVGELTGTPLPRGIPDVNGARRGHDAIAAIRRSLLRSQCLVGPVADQPYPLELVRESADEAHKLCRHGEYGALGLVLPALLDSAAQTAVASREPDAQEAQRIHSAVLCDTAMMLKKLGYPDLAMIAAQQAITVGRASGDYLAEVAAQWTLSEVYFTVGAVSEGMHLVEKLLNGLDGALGDDLATWSLWGTLHTVASTGAALGLKKTESNAHLAEAAEAAERTGERNDYGTSFGPANVALNAVSAGLELGKGIGALDAAADVDFSVLPKERRARQLIDVGRAHGHAHNDAESMEALLEAYSLTPEYTGAHPMARELVGTALERERMSSREPVRAMARRIGILI